MIEQTKEYFDRSALSEAQAVLKNRFPQVMSGYLEDSGTYIEAIENAVERQEPRLLVLNAHPLKASSDAMGIVYIAKIARGLEHMGRLAMDGAEIDYPEAKRTCVSLRQAFTKVRPILLAMLQQS